MGVWAGEGAEGEESSRVNGSGVLRNILNCRWPPLSSLLIPPGVDAMTMGCYTVLSLRELSFTWIRYIA